jgi:threonylcarbamoyladenosine tRNA methylthiotransferase MtaB
MTELRHKRPPVAPPAGKGDGPGPEPEIITFGCRLNAYESEVMHAHVRAGGGEPGIIVNTCAVTNEAVRQARQAIRKAARENPDLPITVTGCAAQIDPDAFAAMPQVARVIGNDEKLRAHTFARGPNARVEVGDIMEAPAPSPAPVDGLAGRARAYVQVQTGCDHRCTFCIIPFGRGNSRSTPIADVVAQVKRLVANGYKEVVLTGVDMTSYGPDLEGAPTLGILCEAILRDVPGLARLRLSSIDSIEVDEALFELIAGEPRLMPHLHLSLQAGDDMILKRMKRRHSRADAIAFCERARTARPEITFGADLIAGFPTETDEMFANTLRLVDDCGLTYLHVFPFSPRPGTPAARMPQVEGRLIKARAAELRAKGEDRLAAYLASRVGAEESVLVERDVEARTESFAQVALDRELPPGSLHKVRITGAGPRHLIGTTSE